MSDSGISGDGDSGRSGRGNAPTILEGLDELSSLTEWQGVELLEDLLELRLEFDSCSCFFRHGNAPN